MAETSYFDTQNDLDVKLAYLPFYVAP